MTVYSFEVVLFRDDNTKKLFKSVINKLEKALEKSFGEADDMYTLYKTDNEIYIDCNVYHNSISEAIDWVLKQLKKYGYSNIVGTRFIKEKKKILYLPIKEVPNKMEKL